MYKILDIVNGTYLYSCEYAGIDEEGALYEMKYEWKSKYLAKEYIKYYLIVRDRSESEFEIVPSTLK